MLKVKLIHHTWITATNGANTVIRSLLDNKDLFANNGIELSSCTLETITNDVYKAPSVSVKSRVRATMKRCLTNLAKYSALASKSVVTASHLLPAQRIISYYNTHCKDNDDILFFHSVFSCYEYLKTNPNRKKIVLVIHSNGDTYGSLRIYYKSLGKSKFYKTLEEMETFVIHNVDRICFVAESAREYFLSLHPDVDPNIVKTIYNGVNNLKALKKDSLHQPLEICCVASVTDRKGQKYILEALEMFTEKNIPNVHFTIIGDGEKRAVLEQKVKSNRLLSNRITFVGISHDVDAYLKDSDIFILPSEDEGLPMAIIEAMRSSLPIISTPVGGIPEMVIPEYNGLLIQPNAKELFELLKNIQKYEWLTMGLNSRKLFEDKFSVDNMIDKYAEIMNSLI